MHALVLLTTLLAVLLAASGQLSHDPAELLNWCLDSNYHKTEPGPEDELHKQCSPWRERSCCTLNVTMSLHNSAHYASDWNHCGHRKLMSFACRRHFIQDLCFYECEPNLGPWTVKVNMKTRKERFFHVPLCASDCDAWYEDCKLDYTCVDNWTTKLIWKKGKGTCPVDSECLQIEQVFTNARHFCESVFDESWKYTSDNQSCMRLYFNSSHGNPNRAVAERRVDELIASWNNGQSLLVACSSIAVSFALLTLTANIIA